MSIADQLSKKPSGSQGGETSQGARTLDEIDFRPQKFLAFGDYKGGKTSFALSVFKWFEDEGFDPEDVKVSIIDNDDGILPLIQKDTVIDDWGIDESWFPRVEYELCSKFDDVQNRTEKFIPALQEHKEEHGDRTAWYIMDNTQHLWQWARDKYAMDVYGMRETTLAKRKRKEAESKGKYTLPTFKQEVDYGVINGIYGDLMEYIKLSGVNFIWLTPSKDEYKDNEKTGNKVPGGQKHDPGRVDNIIYLHKEDGKYYGDLTGSRNAEKLFRKMPDPTVSRVFEFIGE